MSAAKGGVGMTYTGGGRVRKMLAMDDIEGKGGKVQETFYIFRKDLIH